MKETFEETFEEICSAESTNAAVEGLGAGALARLIVWLEAGHGHGFQGLVLSLAIGEAARRFVKQHEAQR